MRYITLFAGIFILSLAVGVKTTAVNGWLTLGALLLVIGVMKYIIDEVKRERR